MPGTRLRPNRTTPRWFLVVLATILLAGACTGGGGPTGRNFHPAGGTLRVGVLLNGAAGGCTFVLCGGETNDPQIEGIGFMSYELERCCLLRTLLSYNGEPTSKGGTILRPDLATELPTVSSDGLVWTFHLKRGLRYAPPLQRVRITSQDFVRSIERVLSEPPAHLPTGYTQVFKANGSVDYEVLGSYLGGFLALPDLIAGGRDYVKRRAQHISGLETPNASTLVVHLTKPYGGLGYLLSPTSDAA